MLVTCACSPNGAPVVMYSSPSGPKAIREPLAPALQSPTKSSWTLVSALPSNFPRASVTALCRCCGFVALDLAGFVVGEVDEPVGRELGMQHYFLQPAGAKRRLLRHTGHGLGLDLRGSALRAGGIPYEPQALAALGDERIAVRKEREAERMRQSSGHDHDADPMLLGGVERIRPSGERHRRDPDLRLLLLGSDGGRKGQH